MLVLAVATEDISTTLEIDYEGDGAVDVTTEETMAEGSTALDLLDAAADAEVETTDWGALVVGIDGVMANWEEDGTWWLFEVNGEQADVAVDGYVLEDGDVVTMSFAGVEEGTITVVLEVDYEGDGLIDKAVHSEMDEGSTALELLNETTELTTEDKEWGVLVIGIDGVMSNYDEEGTWWMFMVDSEPAEVTVDSFVLEQGQTVTMSMGGSEEAEAHETETTAA
ncbi:MAG: hypothetical protein APR56_01835 [Methanosaeta sp. SDB]|nr:MAG: hypothetical protein APR56_01835 [Methanosaeta sp. SDB]